MGSILRLAMLSLLIGLVSCGHSGDDSSNESLQPDTDLDNPHDALQSSTRMNVTLDLPPELVASIYQKSRPDSLFWHLSSKAFAAPVPGAHILVVLMGADGVVTKVLGPEDGLVVNDNGDGTYTVTMPGDPTVNGMVVADPDGGSQIEQGYVLPDGTFYSPASGGDVDLSPESTVATRVALNYLDDFNGITADEISTLVDTLTRIANGIAARMSAMNMGQLEADLTAATADYMVNAIAQAKQDLLFDASGYVGDYVSLSILQSMHTAATGSYVDMRSGYQQRSLSVAIPLPATADAAVDLSKLAFSYDADAPGAGLLNSHLIQTSGTSRRSLSFASELLQLSGLPVNYDGAIVVAAPERTISFTANAANEVQLYPLNGFFYGSDQTIGGMFMSARRDVFDAVADGAQIETEIAIRRSTNFDIANLGGNYGALVSTTSMGGPLTKVRGVQLYSATSGVFTPSTQFNRTTITQQTTSYVDTTNAPGSFGTVVATAGAQADGVVSATLGGLTYQGIGSGDGRLMHVVTADPAGTAGFATFVKLAPSTSLADVSSKRYALFGALDGFEYGYAKTAAVSGFLGLSDSTTIQYLDDSESAEFSRVAVEHLAGASRFHSAYVNTQGLFNIAVNSNGSISFNYADHEVQGFVQAGGDLLVLHDVRIAGASGTYSHQVEDRYYYAICFTGCTTTPDPALFSIGGEVQNLSGSVVLRLNGSELLTVSSSGVFSFVTPQTYGSAYTVDIATQPAAQTCTVSSGTGTVMGNTGSISVVCSNEYTIGGTVSGLSGTLVLQNGTETLNVAANGAFTFPTRAGESASYAVTIATQPANQVCTIANGSGTAAANVTNIAVSCASQYSVSGTLSGLTSGTVAVAMGAETLNLTADGAFSFTNRVASGATYSVSVTSSPAGQTCTVTNGSGTATADVTAVQVSCAASTYTVGGTVTGLLSGGSMQLQINGGETVAVSADGVFTFPTALATGATYSVVVSTQPASQTCAVTNGSGTIAAASVSDVAVSCP